MEQFSPLWDLPVSLLVQVLQKTTPTSFARLRRSCKPMDTVAEKYRKHIGVVLYSINLTPLELDSLPSQNTEEVEKIKKRIRYSWTDQILLQIYKVDIYNRTYMTLPEARKKLSGFTFDKVFAGNNIGFPDASFMEPAVLTAYMDFIRHQRWITSAMLSSYTSMEILNIVKPKILRISDYNMASVKTLEVGYLDDGALPNLRAIPSYVENFLINPRLIVRTEYCLPSLIRDTTLAFYSDKLPVSYVQLERLCFQDATIVKIDDPNNTKAAATILRHYLSPTPCRDNQFNSDSRMFSDKRRKQRGYIQFTDQLITTANTVLTNRCGAKGLLAIRTESLFFQQRFVLLDVSVYFWKGQFENLPPETLEATPEYYQIENAGIY